jgi:hypothetical protein
MLISLAKLWMFFGLRIVWQKLWMFFGMRKNLMEKIMRWKERKDVFATDFGGMFLAFENFSSVPSILAGCFWHLRLFLRCLNFGGTFLAFENFSSVPQFWRDVFGI